MSLTDDLCVKLKAWRKKYPKARFVFGTSGDKPDNQWLEALKKYTEKAGFDPEGWRLHGFRATYCHLGTGVGHEPRHAHVADWTHGLKSVMRYLKGAKKDKVQQQLNQVFAGLG